MIKQIIFLPVFALSVLLLTACDKDHSEPASIIRFGITSAPVTLNPLYATDATSGRIIRLIYQQLIQFGDDNLPVPDLAKWQQINTRHYRFSLIKKSWFHHGKLLTSADIKATYDAVLNKTIASPHLNSLKHIEHIEIIDDLTIDFHLKRADPLFPAFLVIAIMPEDLLKNRHPFNHHYDGQLFLKRQTDQQMFEFLKVTDPTVRVLKLLGGELDLIQNDLPPEHINYLKQQQTIKFKSKKGANY